MKIAFTVAVSVVATLLLSCGGQDPLAIGDGQGQVLPLPDSSNLLVPADETTLLNGHDCCSLGDATSGVPRAGCSDTGIQGCVCDILPSCCDQGWGMDCVVQTAAFCGTCAALDPAVTAVLTRDTDGDGLSDLEETNLGLDPTDPADVIDTDGDGTPNRNDFDLDGDGIPNLLDADIDGDGIANAVDADIDGDGLLNGADSGTVGTQCSKDNDCDDDDDCTDHECANGVCLYPNEDDGESCTNADDLCGKYTCKTGKCTDEQGRKCDDDLACTLNPCNPETGDCGDPFANDGLCDAGERCDEKKGCMCGDQPACEDSSECDADTGTCTCGDEICGDNETCAPVDEGDFALCSCEGIAGCGDTGDCVVGMGCMCGNSDACDLGETCVDGVCRCGEAVACADDETCVDGACACGESPSCGVAGQCVGGSCRCGDGDACDANFECQDGECKCLNTDACDNGVDCLIWQCNDGECVSEDECPEGFTCSEEDDDCHCDGNESCDDGKFCNGLETCGDDGRCQPGQPPVCDDDIECTENRCDDMIGDCVAEPDPDFECGENKVCDPMSGCVDE